MHEISRHEAIVRSLDSRKGLGALQLQVLLAEPLVVRVRVLNCHKFWISAILGGTTDGPPYPSVLQLV